MVARKLFPIAEGNSLFWAATANPPGRLAAAITDKTRTPGELGILHAPSSNTTAGWTAKEAEWCIACLFLNVVYVLVAHDGSFIVLWQQEVYALK